MRHNISAILLIAAFIATAGCKKAALIDALDYGRIRIDSIFPAKGPAGSYFQVYGNNFTFHKEDVKAFIGSTELTVMNVSVETVLLKIPANATAGELKITFRRDYREKPNSGDAMDSVVTTRLFELDPASSAVPGLTGFMPATGGPGTTITVKGYNFSELQNSEVWFGGVKSERLELTDTTMKVKIPASVLEGSTTVYVEHNGKRSQVLPFDMLKPLPQVKTVYYVWGFQIYAGHLEDGIFVTSPLYDANQDVSGVDLLFADSKRDLLYWNDFNTASILQAPMDGSGPIKVVYSYDADSDNAPYKFELSGGKLYVSVFKNSGNTAIVELDKDGGPFTELYDFPETTVSHLRVSEKLGKIYWIEDKMVISANLDGSGNKETIFEVGESEEVSMIELDDQQGKIYVKSFGNNTGQMQLVQISLTGDKTPVTLAITGRPNETFLDRSSGLLYWLDRDDDGVLYRTDAAGSFMEKVGVNLRYGWAFTMDTE